MFVPMQIWHELGERCQAIFCAGSIRHDGVTRLVVLVVDANHIDQDHVLRRGGDDHLLRVATEVQLCLLLLREDTRGLARVLCSCLAPADVACALHVEESDLRAVDYQELLVICLLRGDGAREPLGHAVVFQLVYHVLQVHEGVVDNLDLDLRVSDGRAEHQATDAAEAMDTHGGRHGDARRELRVYGVRCRESLRA